MIYLYEKNLSFESLINKGNFMSFESTNDVLNVGRNNDMPVMKSNVSKMMYQAFFLSTDRQNFFILTNKASVVLEI